jgi:glycosyltransferase involved in cell wall biosynthesis
VKAHQKTDLELASATPAGLDVGWGVSDSGVSTAIGGGGGISLIIPAYNEEARIERALEAYLPVLERSQEQFEVIVVVDGTDRTEEIVRTYASRSVVCIRSARKLGKGGAIVQGFKRANYQRVGYVDADGSLNPGDLSRLITAVDHYDCAVASRWSRDSRWIRKEPAFKRLASRGFNLLVRAVLGLKLNDTQCGAKFYSSDILNQVLRRVTVTNLAVDVGFMYHVQSLGGKITEIPVMWDDQPGSRFRMSRMIVYMFATVIGIRVMNLGLSRHIPESLIRSFHLKFGSV